MFFLNLVSETGSGYEIDSDCDEDPCHTPSNSSFDHIIRI